MATNVRIRNLNVNKGVIRAKSFKKYVLQVTRDVQSSCFKKMFFGERFVSEGNI